MNIGPKSLVFTGIIAVACSTAIVMFMLTSKNSAQETMQSQINDILKKMQCENNECDRYKGKDAERDFAKVYLEIERLKKDCGR
jgi:hypothetical protein